MSTKRPNVDSKPVTQPKRFMSSAAASPMAASPSPPLNMFTTSMTPFYNFSSPPPDGRYQSMTMMNMMDAAAAYSYYGAQSWQSFTTPPPQGAVLFNPSQPPPPLPPDIKRPPPPPPPSTPPPNPPRPPPPVMPMGPRRPMMRPPFQRMGMMERPGMKRPMYPIRHFSPTKPLGAPMKQIIKTQMHRSETPGCVTNEIIDADAHDDNHIQVNKKSKRKPMSTRYTRKREWDREDALKAISLENEYNRLQKTPMLILKFPDPELNKEIVKQYSKSIETVHFQQPSTPRYCFIQLKDGADIDKVKEEISHVEFGTGKIIVEKKNQNLEENQVSPEEIDPYTLYIGNLPTTISVSMVKEQFPTAHRIDIGYAQRMKYTRYAFIRYHSVEEAMEAYRKTFNLLIESRSLIVRFRRQKGNVGLPGETKIQNPKKPQPPAKKQEETKASTAISTINAVKEPTVEVPPENSAETSKKTNEEVDSKVNVLADAERLIASGIHTRKEADAQPQIKREQADDESIHEDEEPVENGILGTRVKDEPLDDEDEYLESSNYYDDMEDEDDCYLPPEDEDEIVDDEYNPTEEDKEEDDEDADVYGRHHWEQLRLKELNTKEEKPDISLLPTFGLKRNDNFPSLLDSGDSQKEDDGLDELFNNMNPDEDDESSTF